jgi:RHS repeat-associated protein
VAAPLFNYSHNARGQMTGRQFGNPTQQFTMSWDSAHRVTQTWNAASSVVETYRYDAHGHRVRTVRGGETVYQVYTQGGDLLMERTNTGTTRKYARLGGRLIGETLNGARRAIHTDVIGSVRQKSDAFGTLVHEDVRAPYGSTLLGWQYQNGPAFTGHMEDGATGLTYMKARYYDPVAMRFISPDPVYVDLGTGGNFNRYWYANNNPYTYTDPDGRLANFAIGFAIGFVLDAGIQYARTGQVDVKQSLISGATGALTGGVGGALTKAAANGTISATTATVGTTATGGVAGGLATAATATVTDQELTTTQLVVGAAVGAATSGVGAAGTNAGVSTSGALNKMSAAPVNSPAGIGGHIASTTDTAAAGSTTATVQGAAAGVRAVATEAAGKVAETAVNHTIERRER